MALADYPYCTTDDAAERAQLEAHIESWLSQQGFEFSDVLVTDLGRQGTLVEIKKTNFNLTGAVIGCEMTLSVRWDFPTLTEIFIDGSLVNLSGYPYCDLIDSPSERTRLINDFTAWLNTNGYYYQDVQIIDRGAVVILTVTQTNLVFDSGRTRNCCTPAECSTGMKEIDASVTNSICSYRIESTLDEIVPCTPTIVDNDNKGETIDNTGSNVIYEVLKSDGSTEWAYKQNLPLIQGDYRLGTRVFVTSPQMKLKVLQTDSTIVEMTADEFITAANTNPGPHPIEPGDGEPTSAECQFDSLGCTPLQIEEQQESISDIMAAMCNTPIESLTFPLTISLVRLCDGSTTYIVGDQFVNQIEGPHVVVDTLILNNPDDVINVLIVKKERLFAMSFSYEPNGNIKKMRWKITNNTVKYYDTNYDPLNRILNANYGQEYLSEVNGNTFITIDPNDAYRAFNFSYDPVGNLQSLSRYGMVPDGNCYSIQLIDQLTYTLDASKHQVTKIADGAPAAYKQYGFKPGDVRSGDHYDYDDNGNLISDEHKELDISYNFLNLPKQITGSGTVDLTYDALGRKWKKVGTTGTFEYVGGLVYKDGKVEAYYDPDGRVVANYINGGATLDGFRAEYWHKDHLGNTRLAFSDVDRNGYITYEDDPDTPNNEMEIFQENHYYPFGMNQDGPWYQTVTPENRYQYNGKELNTDLDLNWHDYGARWYDASIGRWNAVDPLAEDYFSNTGYSYVVNNPFIFIDPDGAKIDVSSLLNSDEESDNNLDGLFTLVNLIDDLSSITGLNIEYREGLLVIGRSQSSTDGKSYSSKARDYLQKLIDDPAIIKVKLSKNSTRAERNGTVYLDNDQIFAKKEAIRETDEDPMTVGFGMTFLHETLHTNIGASIIGFPRSYQSHGTDGSAQDQPGKLVEKVNEFRKELRLATLQNYFPYRGQWTWFSRNQGKLIYIKKSREGELRNSLLFQTRERVKGAKRVNRFRNK